MNSWIGMTDFLANLNNISGFCIDTEDDLTYEFYIHFPTMTYEAYSGTKKECNDIMKKLTSLIKSEYISTVSNFRLWCCDAMEKNYGTFVKLSEQGKMIICHTDIIARSEITINFCPFCGEHLQSNKSTERELFFIHLDNLSRMSELDISLFARHLSRKFSISLSKAIKAVDQWKRI